MADNTWAQDRAAQLAAKAASRAVDGRPAPKASRKSPDRWAALNALVDVQLRELTAAETAVWLILFRDVRNGVARTGMSDIAARAGITRRGVVKAMKGLRDKQLVDVIKRGNVAGIPNTYRVRGAGDT